MLFDLQGKRKRFIQVIYVFLALLLGGSLVFFGIGGDAPGGLGNAVGLDPNSGSTGNSTLDADIETANATLETDPDNQAALVELAKSQAQAGSTALEEDEQGFPVLTEAAIVRFEASVDAWERYLRVVEDKPNKIDDDELATVASTVFQAYERLVFSQTDPVLIQRTLESAVETAQIKADTQPTIGSFVQLATYAYLAGDTKVAEKAEQRALGEVDDSSRDQLKSQLRNAKRQGEAIQQQLKAQSQGQGPGQEGEGAFENPLQGLGADDPAGDLGLGDGG